MSTEKPRWNDVWINQFIGLVQDQDENRIALFVKKEDAARAVACRNACQGMPDPAAEIEAMREAMQAAYEAMYDARDLTENWEDRKLAAAMTKLQPFVAK